MDRDDDMEGAWMEISGLDEVDNRIVALLSENARLSYSEIGQAVGKSRVAVKTRIEQLEKQGIIRGYHAEIDPAAVPGGTQFILDIEAEPQCYEEVLRKLSVSNMIRKIYGTSGESHIHAVGIAPNSETLGSYAGHLYRSTEGMRKLSWQILLTTYKDMERGVEYEIRHQEHEHMEGSTGEEERPEQRVPRHQT